MIFRIPRHIKFGSPAAERLGPVAYTDGRWVRLTKLGGLEMLVSDWLDRCEPGEQFSLPFDQIRKFGNVGF